MSQTADVLRRFNEVFLSHDPAALADLVAEDCIIENTNPAPDGSRHVGRAARIASGRDATAPGTFFESKDVTVMGERGLIFATIGGRRRRARARRESDAPADG
jgi:hypothetical protein